MNNNHRVIGRRPIAITQEERTGIDEKSGEEEGERRSAAHPRVLIYKPRHSPTRGARSSTHMLARLRFIKSALVPSFSTRCTKLLFFFLTPRDLIFTPL